jgi:nicotinamide mononucleotide (NMN) deamidase PncC
MQGSKCRAPASTRMGFVTCTKEAESQLLGALELLRQRGAVCVNTAIAMAEGALCPFAHGHRPCHHGVAGPKLDEDHHNLWDLCASQQSVKARLRPDRPREDFGQSHSRCLTEALGLIHGLRN